MKKGVSLAALIMYVVVLTTIISVITAFNINILGDANDFVSNTKLYEQYTKFNMFFLQVLGENPSVEYVRNEAIGIYNGGYKTIVFDSVNHIVKYTKGTEVITICEFVDTLEFAQVNNTLYLSIRLKMDDAVYQPQGVNYAVGEWVIL